MKDKPAFPTIEERLKALRDERILKAAKWRLISDRYPPEIEPKIIKPISPDEMAILDKVAELQKESEREG